MALTVVKTTALSGTITNAQLAGSIDLTAKVTGTLPTGNGGTGSTATTFVNMTSNVTGTLPAANGGTGATTFSPGKIAQVKQGDSGTEAIISSTTWADCSDDLTITCSATSSKVLVMFTSASMMTANEQQADIRLMRDTSAIGTPQEYINWSVAGGQNVNYPSVYYLDSPSSTSSLTYKAQGRLRTGSGSWYVNYDDASGDQTSYMILMEVLA